MRFPHLFVFTAAFLIFSFPAHAAGPIDWKVGDTETYSIAINSIGTVGSMIKSVTRDDGATLWTREDNNESGRRDIFDRLINKADGKILRLLVNGQERQLEDGHAHPISSESTEITVPAGHFKCTHTVIAVDGLKPYAIWTLAPEEAVMDGIIRQEQPADQPLGLVFELVSQRRAQ